MSPTGRALGKARGPRAEAMPSDRQLPAGLAAARAPLSLRSPGQAAPSQVSALLMASGSLWEVGGSGPARAQGHPQARPLRPPRGVSTEAAADSAPAGAGATQVTRTDPDGPHLSAAVNTHDFQTNATQRGAAAAPSCAFLSTKTGFWFRASRFALSHLNLPLTQPASRGGRRALLLPDIQTSPRADLQKIPPTTDSGPSPRPHGRVAHPNPRTGTWPGREQGA